MKYAIIIPDGAADEPQASLGGRTPLQAARTPAMDAIAAAGMVGRASHVPAHLPPGSEVANMSLLGYDPTAVFTGRAPIEAAAQGIDLGPDDWAIRCNLVTIEGIVPTVRPKKGLKKGNSRNTPSVSNPRKTLAATRPPQARRTLSPGRPSTPCRRWQTARNRGCAFLSAQAWDGPA